MKFSNFITAIWLVAALLTNAQSGAAQGQFEQEQIINSAIEYARTELTDQDVPGKVDIRRALPAPASTPLAQKLTSAGLEPASADTEFIVCNRDGCELIGTKLLIRLLGPPVVEGNEAVVRVSVVKSRADSLRARMDSGHPYVARDYEIGLTQQGNEWVVTSCNLYLMT